MVDMIREAWWSSPRGIGSIHRKHLKSNRADRPNEVVLPDAMICLAGANAWAGLQAWATGHYVPAPEFSQGRLESTYQSLLGILEDQRSGKSSKAFNGIMHDLYVKVSQSQSGVAPNASGSANNVISLDIDSD
ncbi:hypothetical protein DFH09DRAFT_1166687 [Mycena vulgaris]|nr:hypothetical protein DFH09DRAFT_1166687 [Mycena vulgaris]